MITMLSEFILISLKHEFGNLKMDQIITCKIRKLIFLKLLCKQRPTTLQDHSSGGAVMEMLKVEIGKIIAVELLWGVQ